MAEYIAATQRIAVRFRPSAAPATRKKMKGNGKKIRRKGRTVFATVGSSAALRRGSTYLPHVRRAHPPLRLINSAYGRTPASGGTPNPLRLRLQWFASGSTSISPESPFHRSTRRYLPSTDGRYLIPDIWHKVPGTKKAYGTETNIIAPKVHPHAK
ncbi:hypothetical protein B0H14DRAFT_2559461 [Mycena olivaceomarginata]|nr:hypothetical protein B0H14DRAFT_2559461 [Mycena olivaceomarginata]